MQKVFQAWQNRMLLMRHCKMLQKRHTDRSARKAINTTFEAWCIAMADNIQKVGQKPLYQNMIPRNRRCLTMMMLDLAKSLSVAA